MLKKQYEDNLLKQQEMKTKEREYLIKSVIKLAEDIGLKLDNENIFQIPTQRKNRKYKIDDQRNQFKRRQQR